MAEFGPYYQGNNAASLGLTTPTAVDQNAYLGSLQSAQGNNLIQYAGNTGGAQLAQGPNVMEGAGSPGNTGGTPLYYQGTDPTTGTTITSTDPNDPTFGNPNVTNWTPIYGGTSANPNTGGAGSGSTAGTLGGAAGAGAPGYLPPAATGGPAATGITAGLASGINSWITGAETAVGNAFKGAVAGTLGSLENLGIRFFLVLAAIVILGIALWRLAAPNVSAADIASVMKAA